MVHWHGKTYGFLPHKMWVLLIFAAWFLGSGVVGCTGKKVILPRVSHEPTEIRHVGKFIWFDLFTRDLPGACAFYGHLFGWSFEDTAPGDPEIKTIKYDGIAIGNAVQTKPEAGKTAVSRWLSSMSVADVDETVERVVKNGGSIRMPPKDIPHRGRLAWVDTLLGVLSPWPLSSLSPSARAQAPKTNTHIHPEGKVREAAILINRYFS